MVLAVRVVGRFREGCRTRRDVTSSSPFTAVCSCSPIRRIFRFLCCTFVVVIHAGGVRMHPTTCTYTYMVYARCIIYLFVNQQCRICIPAALQPDLFQLILAAYVYLYIINAVYVMRLLLRPPVSILNCRVRTIYIICPLSSPRINHMDPIINIRLCLFENGLDMPV